MIHSRKKKIYRLCAPTVKPSLAKIWYRELKGDLGKRCLYFCPHCKSCLGVSHRKGLTFGG